MKPIYDYAKGRSFCMVTHLIRNPTLNEEGVLMRYQSTLAVYAFVWQYCQEHGFPPTQREIAKACYIARSGVVRHLDRLTLWGWIQREDGKSRGIKPLFPPETAEIPDLAAQKVDKWSEQMSTLFENGRAIVIDERDE